MDIFKFSDDIPVDNKAKVDTLDEDVLCSGELKISDIRQAMRDENRVNIFVNGKYSFSLDVAQVVDLGVKKGLVVTREKLEEFKKASEFGKAYQRALEWAFLRPRSVKELRDYLKRCKMKREMKERKRLWEIEKEIAKLVEEGEIASAKRLEKKLAYMKVGGHYDVDELIIARLCEKRYVDDEQFAKWYIENRNVQKGASQKKLRIELMKKGISREIIEKIMSETGRNDEEEIRKIITKKHGRYDDEKLIRYLCRQGFQYDMVRDLVKESTDW